MSDIAQKYKELEEQVLYGRPRGMTEEQEDLLLEEMDDLWYQMTINERAEVSMRARLRYAAIG